MMVCPDPAQGAVENAMLNALGSASIWDITDDGLLVLTDGLLSPLVTFAPAGSMTSVPAASPAPEASPAA